MNGGQIEKKWHRLCYGAQVLSALIAVSVLLGWQFDVEAMKSLGSGTIAMNPTTAVCFILLAAASALRVKTVRSPLATYGSAALTAAVLTMASCRLCDDLHLSQFGYDQFLYTLKLDRGDIANRMAPNTAYCFFCLSLSVLLIDFKKSSLGRWFAGIAIAVATITLVAYCYGDRTGMAVANYLPMAINTALLFTLLGLSVQASRSQEGIMNLFLSDTLAGKLFRKLSVSALVIPFGVGWLRLAGVYAGWYDSSFGIALETVATMLILGYVILSSALTIQDVDGQRTQAEAELQTSNAMLELRVEQRTTDLQRAQSEVFDRLAIAAEYRDDDTGEHTKRVGETARKIALELGMSPREARDLGRAAQLHDIGKIGVSDSILHKPAPLTEEEFAAMKDHIVIGAKILSGSSLPLLQLAEEIAHSHHEKWNGKGYLGIKGEEIPLSGRIVAVADVFDALTSERPYKRAWSTDEALEHIVKESGQHFDPAVVRAFLRTMGYVEEDTRRAA